MMKTPTFADGLRVQGRVLGALVLRDIGTTDGKSRLGYLWRIIRMGFTISIFWALREFGGFRAPGGMATPVYLLVGVGMFFMFRDIVQASVTMVPKNQSLFTFPMVTQLDPFLSHLLADYATTLILMGIFFGLFYFLGYSFILFSPPVFLGAFLGMGIFGFGSGLVVAAMARFFPVLAKLIPMILRIMMFTSGVFFSPDRFGQTAKNIYYWNPVAVYIELMRGSFLSTHISLDINLGRALTITVCALSTGLLLERYVRNIPEKL